MKLVEYEFVLPDGSKRYEFVDPDNDMSVMQQLNFGMKLDSAVAARPAQPTFLELDSEQHPAK